MSGLQVIITKAGRAALINAKHDGTSPVTIREIGLSDTAFIANEELTGLPGEFKRISTISGETVAPATLHVTIRDEGTDRYNVYGIGYWLSNGVLFAVYAQDEPLLQKSSQSMLLLSVDMVLTSMDAASITFGDSNFTNPPATTEQPGVVELASAEETVNGTDAARVVTPAGLSAALTNAKLTSTDALIEGNSNLYWSMERVRNTILAGLTFASNAVISASDTVISALGKLQQQIIELGSRKADANGANASGTWNINTTGSAAYAANAYYANTTNIANIANVAVRAYNGIVSISYRISGPYNGGASSVYFTFLTFVFFNGTNLSIATGNITQGSWYDPQVLGIPVVAEWN